MSGDCPESKAVAIAAPTNNGRTSGSESAETIRSAVAMPRHSRDWACALLSNPITPSGTARTAKLPPSRNDAESRAAPGATDPFSNATRGNVSWERGYKRQLSGVFGLCKTIVKRTLAFGLLVGR